MTFGVLFPPYVHEHGIIDEFVQRDKSRKEIITKKKVHKQSILN